MTTGIITATARQGGALNQKVYESGAQSGEVVNVGPVTLTGLYVTNTSASLAYLFLYDSASAPSGLGQFTPIAVPATSTVSVAYTEAGYQQGRATATGLGWAGSSSATSLASVSTLQVQLRFFN